jgi:fatty-acyl-CoA synthase
VNIPLNTRDFCYRARTVYPDRLGVADEPEVPGNLGRMTYGEVMQRCDGMIATLDELGIGMGERVAIISPNSAKLLITLFATMGSGRIFVPINFRITVPEAQFIVDDCEAALVLIDPLLAPRFVDLRAPRIYALDGTEDAEMFVPINDGNEWPSVDEILPASINYTSGTTSQPKGVVLSHRSHWLNAVSVALALGLREDDTYLHTLPIFHVNGWGLPLANASYGVSNILQRDIRGDQILTRVASEQVSLLCGATPVAAEIVRAARELKTRGEKVPGDGVTRMVSGGAPTPPAVIEEFESTTGWEMIHAYGLTESGPVLTVNRVPLSETTNVQERAKRLASAGPPLLGVQLRVDDNGEIWAKTAKTMTGYWNQPLLSETAWNGTWLLTGDGGVFGRGMLRISDRKKDVIVSGGENISSLEIEACLLSHTAVSDVAVIGVPHDRWGETPRALVVVRKGSLFDEQELLAFCRERLAHFKCPTAIEQRQGLPRTATGKVQKFLLRAQYWT